MADKLTVKQRNFIDHYLITFNALQSALEAGYSEKTALKESYKMLANPKIKKELDRRMKEIQDANPAIARPEEVLVFLSKMMRGEITDERLMVAPGEGVSLHHIKSQSEARLKAAELLGKANQLFTDKVNVNANVQQVVFEGEDDLED